MLSIAICDDEEYFRITEKQLILKYMAGKNCECMIDMYESGKELLALKSAISQYHIIFLDVNMEEIDGIETAKEIRKITKDVFIVFVTAFITYALEGYKVDAVRYLIKDHESLEKAMTECMDTILEKMLMCDKVTHKKLIDSNLLFRKISRNLLSKMIQYNSKKIFF